MVPALSIGQNNGGGFGGGAGNPNISIRGITSTVGAATTGIYLDDVPLTVRNGNPGTPSLVLPQLFDLDRVEVLRGPQGTLYGGSSEGGTVRFLAPNPSFTQATVNGHLEGSQTQGGDPNAEAGVAVGGPLAGVVGATDKNIRQVARRAVGVPHESAPEMLLIHIRVHLV
jgi:outer membrane receptor protein involved in Fe transport